MSAAKARKEAGTDPIKGRRPPHGVHCPKCHLLGLLLTL